MSRVAAAVRGWWFPAVPRSRVAVLRTFVYLFVIYDVFRIVDDVVPHAYAPPSFYRPLFIPRLLGLPAPNPVYAHTLRALIVVAALAAAAGRFPRLAGWVVAFGYLDWIFIGFSYGKVDHDHLALLVALFVLPTVRPATPRDAEPDEAAGWALRCIQIGVVCTYFLSAWAKVRVGGWGWVNSATFYWAVTRRGTDFGDLLLRVPKLLVFGQWAIFVMELLTPVVLFVRGRARLLIVLTLVGFHAMTFATIKIHFLPTVVCLLAFAPLERLPGWLARRLPLARHRAGGGPAGEPVPVPGDDAIEGVREPA